MKPTDSGFAVEPESNYGMKVALQPERAPDH